MHPIYLEVLHFPTLSFAVLVTSSRSVNSHRSRCRGRLLGWCGHWVMDPAGGNYESKEWLDNLAEVDSQMGGGMAAFSRHPRE